MRASRPALAAILACAAGGCAGDGADEAGRLPFTDLTTVASPAGAGAAEPNLAVGPDNAVYLSWLEPTSDGHALRFAIRDGAGWSEPRTIAESDLFFVNWADFPSLIALADGSLVAHWLQKSGPGTYAYDVRTARSTDGGRTWAASVVPHRDGTQTEHGFVTLVPWPGAALAAIWLDGRKYAGADDPHAVEGGEMTLRFAALDEHLEPVAEAELDERTCDCCQTDAAWTDDGAIVAYRDRTSEEVRDISVVRWTDGAWTAPSPVHDDGWVIPACPVNGPAIDAAGTRVAVAWYTGVSSGDAPADTEQGRVLVAFSEDAGASFGEPVRIDDGAPVGRVDLVLLEDGGALVSWIERLRGSEAEVRVRRASAAGTGPAVEVARTTAARPSGFPRMRRVGSEVVFAWTEPGDPTGVRIATARLLGGDAPERVRQNHMAAVEGD